MSASESTSNNPSAGHAQGSSKQRRNDHSFKRQSPSWFMRVCWPLLLFGYLAVTGGVAIWLISRAWPNSDWLIQRFEARARPALQAEVGREAIARLQRAQMALARWHRSGAESVTRADEQAINDAFAYVASLAIRDKPARPVATGGDLRTVPKKDLEQALDSLGTAIVWIRDHYLAPQPGQTTRLSAIDEAVIRERMEELRLEKKKQTGGNEDLNLFALIAAFGALGAAIQGVHSIALFVGNRRFLAHWSVFYFSRPLVGAGVAVAIYFLLRAGIFSPGTAVDTTSVFGACAVAVMVGLFSGQAMEKLRAVADAFFKNRDDRDSLEGQLPHLVSISSHWPDSSQCVLHIDGQNFHQDSMVLVNHKLVRGSTLRLDGAKEQPATQGGDGEPVKVAEPTEGGAALVVPVGAAPEEAAAAAAKTEATEPAPPVKLEAAGMLSVVLKGEFRPVAGKIYVAVFNPSDQAGLSNTLEVKLKLPSDSTQPD